LTDDHPGVQGEANRLLAWIVKNSKSSEVVKIVAAVGGVRCLVSLLAAEYAVMRNEALLAVALVAANATELPEQAVKSLREAAPNLSNILKDAKDEQTITNVAVVIKLLIPIGE
jgi:hypothetical protein